MMTPIYIKYEILQFYDVVATFHAVVVSLSLSLQNIATPKLSIIIEIEIEIPIIGLSLLPAYTTNA
jgi:hypothetical protein